MLFFTYYFTKSYAKRSVGNRYGKHITVLETITLGKEQSLHLIKLLDKIILVGVSHNSINELATFDIDDYEALAENLAEGSQRASNPAQNNIIYKAITRLQQNGSFKDLFSKAKANEEDNDTKDKH